MPFVAGTISPPSQPQRCYTFDVALLEESPKTFEEAVNTMVITTPFSMQTTTVTQAQWRAVMTDNRNPSNYKSDDLPVEQVSWDDAARFCSRLSEKEGQHYRLPTEAEWEYACRAGTTTAYYTGDTEQDLDKAGWYEGNSRSRMRPVGQKQPNLLGLYDMHGNVWEWCYDVYATFSKADVVDPKGPQSNAGHSMCLLRGGSWGDERGSVGLVSGSGTCQYSGSTIPGFESAWTPTSPSIVPLAANFKGLQR